MKERMQKTLSQVNGCPQRDRSETEWYGGVQTFMWMCEDNIVEVPFNKEHLFEQILSPANLNRAYKAVMRNKGCGGIDKMSCEQLLPWLMTNKDVLIRSLMDGSGTILVGHEPWEQLLTRHLVDTATAFVSHNSLVNSVEIRRTEDLLEKVFLVEWYFHDVVFTHPHEGLHSPIPFGFRPISLGQPLTQIMFSAFFPS